MALFSYAAIMKHIDGKSKGSKSRVHERSVKFTRTKICKPRGKPIVWGSVEVSAHKQVFATVTPDGIVTFQALKGWISRANYFKAFGLIMFDNKNTTYIVRHGQYARRRVFGDADERKSWPHWEPGLQFDLKTMAFVNAKFDKEYDKDADGGDTVWKGKMIKFHKIMQVYVKLEALQFVIDEERAKISPVEPTGAVIEPWSTDAIIAAMVEAVRESDPVAMSRALCWQHTLFWKLRYAHQSRYVNGETIHAHYKAFYNRNRTEVRVMAGAIRERKDDGDTLAVPT